VSKKNWKNVELFHSKLLRCSGRTGPTGRDLPDSYSDLLTVESKCSNRPPRLLGPALVQAEENTARLLADDLKQGLPERNRLPVVVFHEDGAPFRDDWVVMRMRDFVAQVLPALEKNAGNHADPMAA
jgi:hypothetical protein